MTDRRKTKKKAKQVAEQRKATYAGTTRLKETR